MKNNTEFVRKEKKKNYTIVSNFIITSKNLTVEESFLLIYLLSLPDTWKLYKTNIEKEFKQKKISKSRFNKSWKGLQNKGYIESSRVKDEEGKFTSWKYRVIEDPKSEPVKTDMSENQNIGKPITQNKVDILNTKEINTNIEITKENINTSILGELSEFNKNIIINNRNYIKKKFPKYPQLLNLTKPEEIINIKSGIPITIWNNVCDKLMQISIAFGN